MELAWFSERKSQERMVRGTAEEIVGLSNDGKLQGQNGCIAFLLKPIGEKGSHIHTIPLHIHKDCQEPQKAVSRAQSICMQL